MDTHKIFRIPYGYQEETFIESKKNIIIQKLETFLLNLQAYFNSEIDKLKNEDKIIHERINNITIEDMNLDMGTFTYKTEKNNKKNKKIKSYLI